jgi:hypothetical protein
MTNHELPLVAFLAGDLDLTAARAVDEHLLACDQCWLVVREDRVGRAVAGRLRAPTDPGLADRIRLTVALAPLPKPGRPIQWARAHIAGVAAVTAVVAVALTVLTVVAVRPQHRAPGRDSAALRQVVALATELPPADGGSSAGAVALDAPHAVRAGGQTLMVQTYAFDGRAALIATSPRPFAAPADARMTTGSGMPWAVARGSITIYCPRADVLLAGRASAEALATLAHVLHLT